MRIRKSLPLALMASCLLMTGCQKGVEMQPDKSNELMEIELELNGFNTYSDIDFYQNSQGFGFEEGVPMPDRFSIAGQTFTEDDFVSVDALCLALSRLNTVTQLNLNEWQGNMLSHSNTSDVFEEALKQRNYTCNFYFNPMNDSVETDPTVPGIIGITVNNMRNIAVVCVEFCGGSTDPNASVIFTYNEQQLNVMKTSASTGIVQWQIGAFDVPEVKAPVETEEPTHVEVSTIDFDSVTLDTDIIPTPAMVDDTTYTGVIYLSAQSGAVHAGDINDTTAAISAIIRMSSTMNTYIGPSHTDVINLGSSLTPMHLEQLLEDEGSVFVEMYDFAGNNKQLTAELTADKLIFTVYHMEGDISPDITVCYDKEYVAYTPYKYNHQMSIEFSTTEN